MSTEHTTDTEVLPDPEIVEVSEGIYAYIQHDGSWCLNNPAFVDVGDQVIAIDACATSAARTRLFRRPADRAQHLQQSGADPGQHPLAHGSHIRQLPLRR